MHRRRPTKIAIVLLLAAASFTTAGAAALAQVETYRCSDAGTAVAIDGRGGTLVAGSTFDNRVQEWPGGHAHFGDFAVSQLDAGGHVDSRFGQGGSVILDHSDFDQVTDVATDRRWVLLGGSTAILVDDRKGPQDAVVIRLGSDGAPDHRFGTGGLAVVDLGGDDAVTGVVPAPGGGVYAAGWSSDRGDAWLMRLTRLGRLDHTFGSGGVAWVDADGPADRSLGLRSYPQGVVLAGVTSRDGVAAAFTARLDHRGRPVGSYGSDGLAVTTVGGQLGFGGDSVHYPRGHSAVTLMTSGDDGAARVATVRFGPDGAPAAPTVVDVPGGDLDAPEAVAIGPRGSLYLSGATYPDSFASGDAFLARLDRDGRLDPRFDGGVVTARYSLEFAAYNAVAADKEGITVAGWDFSEEPGLLELSDVVLARYRSDGSLDSAFGEGGVVRHDFQGGAAVCGPATVLGEDEG